MKLFPGNNAGPLVVLSLIAGFASISYAQSLTQPVISDIQPDHGFPSAGQTVSVTISGSGFKQDGANLTLSFTPATVKPGNLTVSENNVKVDLQLAEDATGIIQVTAVLTPTNSANAVKSAVYLWNTGINNTCLEAVAKTGCTLRWEVDASGATSGSSQTNTNTAPNLLFKLDWLISRSKDSSNPKSHLGAKREAAKNAITTATLAYEAAHNMTIAAQTKLGGTSPNNTEALSKAHAALASAQSAELTKKKALDKVTAAAAASTQPGAQGFVDRFDSHLIFKTGYTQTSSATTLVPTTNLTTGAGQTQSSGACTGTAPTTTTAASKPCTAATPQQAFIAEAGATGGWSFLQDGQGTFLNLGVAARGTFQNLIQSNQTVQSGGVSYTALSALNSKNAAGI